MRFENDNRGEAAKFTFDVTILAVKRPSGRRANVWFVFSQGWLQETTGGYRFNAQDSKVSAKFQYALRL